MDLPWMGLGLSTNLRHGDRPDPWRILDFRPDLIDYVEYSAPLDVEEARRRAGRFDEMMRRRDQTPALFHPVHLNLWGPELEPPQSLEALDQHCRTVGSPWVSNDVAWWHAGGEMFPGFLYIAPPLTEAAAMDCARHALHVQRHLSVPLLLENPAIFAPRGPLHVADFMARLHTLTGLGLLLDLGHLYAHQLSRGLDLRDGLDHLPLHAVVEVHVAGGVVTRQGARRFYLDDHRQPVHEPLLTLLVELLPRLTGLRAVTFEGDGHPELLAMEVLQRLRPHVPRTRGPALPAPEPQPDPQGGLDPAAAWAVFSEVFDVPEQTDDPDGLTAETDYRLAVLADRLDRTHPLTRLLLAPSRADLLAFSRSEAFQEGFFRPGQPLPARFAAWARARLAADPRPGATAAFAFETWASTTVHQPPPLAPPPGHVGLAPDVRIGLFPQDLGELLHAAGVLRLHLGGRAEATGTFDATGLTLLEEVAARAPRRPWPVALRGGSRLSVIGLTTPVAEVLQEAAHCPPRTAWLAASGVRRAAVQEAARLGLLRGL